MKRMVFPVGEKNNNASGYASGVSALGGPDEINTRLWWDKAGGNF